LVTTCNKNEQQQDGRIMLSWRPNGRRGIGRPLKRVLQENETGLLRPDWLQMMMMMMSSIYEN
jgi:hypothetical protein